MTSLQYILQTTVFKKEKEVLEICCVFPSVTFKTKCTQAAKSGSGTRRWKQHRRQNQQKKSNFLVAASTWRVIKRCQSYYLGVRRSIGVFLFPCRFLPIQILKETAEMGGWLERSWDVVISASKTDVSRESVEDRRRRSCSVTGETFLSLCTKKNTSNSPSSAKRRQQRAAVWHHCAYLLHRDCHGGLILPRSAATSPLSAAK